MSPLEKIRRGRLFICLDGDFDIAELFGFVVRYFKLDSSDEKKVREKTLEVLESFLESGQFKIAVLPDLKTQRNPFGEDGFFLVLLEDMEVKKKEEFQKRLSKEETLLKLKALWDSVSENNYLTWKVWIQATKKGLEKAKRYYNKQMDLDEEVFREIDRLGCLNFNSLIKITAGVFATGDLDEVKFEILNFLDAGFVELGFLKGGKIEKWEPDSLTRSEVFEERWEEFSTSTGFGKDFCLVNNDDVKKWIKEWKQGGRKGKILQDFYEEFDD